MRELEKSESANSLMTIIPIMNIERQKWGDLVITRLIDDGVF